MRSRLPTRRERRRCWASLRAKTLAGKLTSELTDRSAERFVGWFGQFVISTAGSLVHSLARLVRRPVGTAAVAIAPPTLRTRSEF